MCCALRAAEAVSYCEVPCVAARPGVAQNFLTAHAQTKLSLSFVGVAPFAKDSVWNGEKQQFSRPVFQNGQFPTLEDFDWTGQPQLS